MLAARRVAAAFVAGLLALHYLDALVVDLPVGPLASDWAYYLLLAVICASIFLRAFASQQSRTAWILMGAGALAWTAGDAYYTVALQDDVSVPIPSPADAGYLLMPVLMLGGIMSLVRTHAREIGRAQVADGVIVGLAVAAGCSAIFFDTVVEHLGGSPAEIIVNLAYPLLDVLLIGVVAGALAGMGWRLDPTLLLLALGLALFAVADSIYLVQVAEETYEAGGWLDAGWATGLLLVAVAACGPAIKGARRREGEDLRPIAVPLGFATLAVSLLAAGSLTSLNPLAVFFAAACLVAVLARLLVTFQHNVQILGEVREEALNDALTSLRNRRALLADLAEAMFGVQERGERYALILLDLEGIKEFNDTLGRTAGDALLQRLAGRLRLTAHGMGAEAYRTRGGEFALLVNVCTVEHAAERAERAADSVRENIDGFDIGCKHSYAVLGLEAPSIPEAMRLADQRLQEHRVATL